MTSAMAQQGRNGQRANGDDRRSGQTGGYSNNNSASRNDDNQTSYRQNSGYQQESSAHPGDYNNVYGSNDRQHQGRYRDNGYRNNNRRNQYNQRSYGYNNGRGFERNPRNGVNARISIIFGKPRCF